MTWTQSLSVPFDARKLLRLYEYIAQGLAFWHWGVYIPRESHEILASFVIPEMEVLFDGMLAIATARRAIANLNDGVFLYTGIQDTNHPELTVWRMSLYSGATLGCDPQVSPHMPSRAYVLTGPKNFAPIANLVRTLRR